MKDSLYLFAEKEGIDIYEYQMPSSKLKGLYSDGIVILSDAIGTEAEKDCILAEELGHYSTNYGNIINNTTNATKQEKIARTWAYNQLVSFIDLIDAFKYGCRNRFEICDYLNITEKFLDEALSIYKEKYGVYHVLDNYILYFEPLGVMEIRKP